jgi:hypothetical protein
MPKHVARANNLLAIVRVDGFIASCWKQIMKILIMYVSSASYLQNRLVKAEDVPVIN